LTGCEQRDGSGGVASALSPFQARCCMAIQRAPNAMASVTHLAHAVRSNHVAVSSAMRALERRGLADSFPSDDSRWAVRIWYLKKPACTTDATT
jgi:hypothetical protein